MIPFLVNGTIWLVNTPRVFSEVVAFQFGWFVEVTAEVYEVARETIRSGTASSAELAVVAFAAFAFEVVEVAEGFENVRV